MMNSFSRRDLFAAAAGAAVLSGVPATARALQDDPWTEAARIEARIRPPSIPGRSFPITDFGAEPGALCTAAIAAAIAAASDAGGGRVIVPPGEWLTGAVHLKSHVELHIALDAVLKFSTDPADFLPRVLTRFEGVELMNYSPFIYAYGQHDIAVTGEGTIDGQATRENWWGWVRRPPPGTISDRTALFNLAEEGVPPEERLFGEGHTIRPNFVQPYRCKNVLVEGVTVVGSPMWEIHPVECQNVIVRGLNINSHGPNNDGCNPESCRDVLIEDCVFDTGDDCIAIKSGRNADGRRLNVPAENIIVRNCRMADGHGGITMGSEISGGVRNIFMENCRLDSPNLDIAIRFKNNARRGGKVENIFARNITVGQVARAVISVNYNYEEGANGDFMPDFHNFRVENLTSGLSPLALNLQGFPDSLIRDITLVNCHFSNVENGNELHHVSGLKAENVTINGAPFRPEAAYGA